MGHDGSGGSGSSKANQEIDVCENDSKNQYGYSTNLHTYVPTHTLIGAKSVTSTTSLSAEFHTYGCEFTPLAIKYYFDNSWVRTDSNFVRAYSHNDANIWLTTIASWLGNTRYNEIDTTRLPSAAIFDYVRFYQLKNIVYPPLIPKDTTTKIPNPANPQIIVDNTDAGCTFDSPWTASSSVAGFQGSNYYTDGSGTADATKWAKWTPTILADGTYRVYMKWTTGTTRPTAAPIEIMCGEGTITGTVNQTLNNGTWNFLGEFLMLKGTANYVKIFANTPGYTIADAVLFEKLPGVLTKLNSQTGSETPSLILSNDLNKGVNATINLEKKSVIKLIVYNESGTLVNSVLSNYTIEAGKHLFSLTNSTMKNGFYVAILYVNGKQISNVKFILK